MSASPSVARLCSSGPTGSCVRNLCIGARHQGGHTPQSQDLQTPPRHPRVHSPRSGHHAGTISIPPYSSSNHKALSERSPSRSTPVLRNPTSVLVKPPTLPSGSSTSSTMMKTTTADVQPPMWVQGDSMESIMLDDTPGVSFPLQVSRQTPPSPRGLGYADQQHAGTGLFAHKSPEGAMTPKTMWWPGQFLPEGVSSAPAVPEGQVEKESSVAETCNDLLQVRALSARLPAFASLFSARCTTVPSTVPSSPPWNHASSVLSNDPQLPVLYFSD